MDPAVIDLSRLQFALTALYHFLFVPLTLGLSFMLVIMESIYVMTKRPIWRTVTRFWGVLFGINFAIGVATGITMEFQFGMNWSYYSHYVGDIFGAPLAIEGLMAFFLEATFVGLMFFGWEKLSRIGHLAVTFLTALGTNLSALWILVANGWMQNPMGATFNPDTMCMEVSSFRDVLFNPVAQAKFVHTVSAGYVIAAVFVLGISALYLLRGKYVAVAKRSMTVAAAFGLASSLSVVVLGDESGYALTDNQKMKLAALEAMWNTEPAPAGLTAFGIPDLKTRTTHNEIKIPYVLGLIATRSVDMGYALLLKRYVADPRQASPDLIKKTAWDVVPPVPVMFWSFRVMAGVGFLMIALFATAFLLVTLRKHDTKWFLVLAVAALPLPWLSAELGWVLAEMGRQPWAVDGVLPTFLGASSLSVPQLLISITAFTLLYGSLAVVEIGLIVRTINKGPFAKHDPVPGGSLPEPEPAVA